jgi:hypothetical protein
MKDFCKNSLAILEEHLSFLEGYLEVVCFFYPNFGYFGVMVPPVSVKPCHFKSYCSFLKIGIGSNPT